jgi:hypothetical protein
MGLKSISINVQGRIGDYGLVLCDSENERVAGCYEIGNEILNSTKSGFFDQMKEISVSQELCFMEYILCIYT